MDEFHRYNVVPPSSVGKIEKASILRCSQRRDQFCGLDEAKKLTDTEATDRAALDLAIQISRHDHLGWASDDVEACLQMALDVAPNYSSGERKTSSRQQYQQSNALVSSEFINDATSDLVAVQQDLIKTAAEQSERDYIEKEILSSFTTYDDSKHTEDELLAQAKLASLTTVGHNHQTGDDEDYLNLAIQKSLSEKSAYYNNNSDHKQNSSLGHTTIDSEDAMLQAAIQESLRNNNTVSVSRESKQYNNNPNEFYHIDELDEDLSRAIADSLKNLQ